MRSLLIHSLIGLLLAVTSLAVAAPALLSCTNAEEFRQAFSFLDGYFKPAGPWIVTDQGMTLDAPLYKNLPETARDGFEDTPETYYLQRYVPMWRYAVAGEMDWSDYTVTMEFQVQRPAPMDGYRAGDVSMNDEFMRESSGCDLGMLLRYQHDGHYYQVRLSTGFNHLELWKTWGGIVQAVPHTFDPGKTYELAATVSGRWIVIAVNGKEVLRYYDPIRPLDAGRVGVAVRESRVNVSAFTVTPAQPIMTPAPAHTPTFSLRSWAGHTYVFDGNEPLGRIGGYYREWSQYGETRMVEVKLLRGYTPLVQPSLGMVNYNYATAWIPGKATAQRQGKDLQFTVPLTERKDRGEMLVTMTVAYDPVRDGYIWEKQVEYRIKEGAKITTATGDLDDPYFYLIPTAPTTGRMHGYLPLGYPWAVIKAIDSKLYRYTISHNHYFSFWEIPGNVATGSKGLAPDGFQALVLSPDAAAVMEVFPDNPFPSRFEICSWGFDYHLRASKKPEQEPRFYDDQPIKERVKFYAWTAREIEEMEKTAILLTRPSEARVHVYREPVNTFNTTILRDQGHALKVWGGRFRGDNTVGRNDQASISLVFDEKVRKATLVPDKSATVTIGPMDWTGPYLAKQYRIRAWVKSNDQLRGTAYITLTTTLPKRDEKGRQISVTEQAKLPIDGVRDWTPIELITEQPRLAWGMSLIIGASDDDGDGVLWIDDVSVEPVD